MGIDSCFETCRQFSMPDMSSSATAMLMARDSRAASGVVGIEGSSLSDHCWRSSTKSFTVIRDWCMCVLCGGTDKLETILRYRIRSGRGGLSGITRVEQRWARIVCTCRGCWITGTDGAALRKSRRQTCSRRDALATLAGSTVAASHASFGED